MKCGTSKTPLWRNGPDGRKTLCNACGVRMSRQHKGNSAKRSDGQEETPSPSGSISMPESTAHGNPTASGARRLSMSVEAESEHDALTTGARPGPGGTASGSGSARRRHSLPSLDSAASRPSPSGKRKLPPGGSGGGRQEFSDPWMQQQMKQEPTSTSPSGSAPSGSNGGGHRPPLSPVVGKPVPLVRMGGLELLVPVQNTPPGQTGSGGYHHIKGVTAVVEQLLIQMNSSSPWDGGGNSPAGKYCVLSVYTAEGQRVAISRSSEGPPHTQWTPSLQALVWTAKEGWYLVISQEDDYLFKGASSLPSSESVRAWNM